MGALHGDPSMGPPTRQGSRPVHRSWARERVEWGPSMGTPPWGPQPDKARDQSIARGRASGSNGGPPWGPLHGAPNPTRHGTSPSLVGARAGRMGGLHGDPSMGPPTRQGTGPVHRSW